MGAFITIPMFFFGAGFTSIIITVTALMMLVEVLQYLGMLKFKFYFIPVLRKPNRQNYSEAKWLDSVMDVLLGCAGSVAIYCACWILFKLN